MMTMGGDKIMNKKKWRRGEDEDVRDLLLGNSYAKKSTRKELKKNAETTSN